MLSFIYDKIIHIFGKLSLLEVIWMGEKKKRKRDERDYWLLDAILSIPELIFYGVRALIINLLRFWN